MLTMYARNWWAQALRGVLAVILAFRLPELRETECMDGSAVKQALAQQPARSAGVVSNGTMDTWVEAGLKPFLVPGTCQFAVSRSWRERNGHGASHG